MSRYRTTLLRDDDWRPPDAIDLTKTDVALRQLNHAIRLSFADGDPVVMHVLVSSAWDVVQGIAGGPGADSVRRRMLDHIREEYRDEFAATMSEAYNFMKHGGRDANATLVFSPRQTEMTMFLACADLHGACKVSSFEVGLFQTYWLEQQPECSLDAGFLGAMQEEARVLAGAEHVDKAAAARVLVIYDDLKRRGYVT